MSLLTTTNTECSSNTLGHLITVCLYGNACTVQTFYLSIIIVAYVDTIWAKVYLSDLVCGLQCY